MVIYTKFKDNVANNGTCIKFFASTYQDWKSKEKEILQEFPEAISVSMPGIGYAGEYWYSIKEEIK